MARVRLPLLLSGPLALAMTALGLDLVVYSYREYDQDVARQLGFPLAAMGLALLIVAVVGWRRDSAVMAQASCVIWATLMLLLAYAAGRGVLTYAAGGGVASLPFVVIAIAFTSLGVWAARA